jgi:hypothetical protein
MQIFAAEMLTHMNVLSCVTYAVFVQILIIGSAVVAY